MNDNHNDLENAEASALVEAFRRQIPPGTKMLTLVKAVGMLAFETAYMAGEDNNRRLWVLDLMFTPSRKMFGDKDVH